MTKHSDQYSTAFGNFLARIFFRSNHGLYGCLGLGSTTPSRKDHNCRIIVPILGSEAIHCLGRLFVYTIVQTAYC